MINQEKLLKGLRKHWFSYLFYLALAIVIISPDAKSWLLRQVVSTGILKANIKKSAAGDNLQTAAPFSFIDAAGRLTSTEGLKGKVVFINFWASWCPPCRAEMPDLQDLYLKLKDDKRFVFLFINEDEDPSKATSYLEKNRLMIPLLFVSGDVPNELFKGTLPTTVVLDKEGKIVLMHEGMARYNSADFLNQLQELVK